jgi:hypothetical protein
MTRSEEKPVFEWDTPNPVRGEDRKLAWAVGLMASVAVGGMSGLFLLTKWMLRLPTGDVVQLLPKLGFVTVLVCLVPVALQWLEHRRRVRVGITARGIVVGPTFFEGRKRFDFTNLRYVRFGSSTFQKAEAPTLCLITLRWTRLEVLLPPQVSADFLRSILAGKVPICHADSSGLEEAMRKRPPAGAMCLGVLAMVCSFALLMPGLAWSSVSELRSPDPAKGKEQLAALEKRLSEAGFTEDQVKALTYGNRRSVEERGVLLYAVGWLPVIWVIGDTQRRSILFLAGRETDRLLAVPPPTEASAPAGPSDL